MSSKQKILKILRIFFFGRDDDFRMVDLESLHGDPYYRVAKMHKMSCIYRLFVANEVLQCVAVCCSALFNGFLAERDLQFKASYAIFHLLLHLLLHVHAAAVRIVIMSIYIYIHTHTYISVYIYAYMYIYIYIYLYVYIYIYIYIYMYVCIYIHYHECYVCIYMCVSIYMYIYIYVHICTCTL